MLKGLLRLWKEQKPAMLKGLLRLWKDQAGQDLIEYALLLLLIGLMMGATVRTLGNRAKSTYSNTATKVANHTGNNGGNNGGDGDD